MQTIKVVLSNRHLISIVTLLLIGWGIYSFLTIPRSEDPQLEFTCSLIFALLPGASPEEVEKLVVDPIEEELYKLSDIQHIVSSSAENVALVTIQFEPNTDPEDKAQEVVFAVNKAKNSLPSDVAQLEVNKYSLSDVAILQFAFVSETMPYHELVDEAEVLKNRLRRISGIEKIKIHAYPKQQVNIEIAPEKLEAAGITLEHVNQILHGANMAIPGGSLIADQRRFSVRINSEFNSIEDIGNTIIGAYGNLSIRLADIATISLTDADTLYRARFCGRRAIFVTLMQKKGTNIFEVTKKVKEEITAFQDDNHSPVSIETVFDQSRSVDRRLNGFFSNLLQGVVLVGFITIIALGFASSTIIIFVILLSILTAIGILDVAGFGLDQISIVSLAIALGMLVDNAIVVVELVTRKKMDGMSSDNAAISTIHEVGGALTISTLTTIIAFLPLAFLQSYTGQFIRGLPLTVIFALSASLLFALTITPLLTGGLSHKIIKQSDKRLGCFLYKMSENHYRKLLDRILKYPKIVLLIALLLFISSLFMIPHVKMSLFPTAEKPQIFISIETPKGCSISRADSTARAVERVLAKHPNVINYATNIGKVNPSIYYNMVSHWESPNIGQIMVTLSSGRETEVARIVNELRNACSKIPSAIIHIQELQQGLPLEAPIAIRIIGEDLDSLKAFADIVETTIIQTEGTVNIRNPIKETRTDLRVTINRDKASLVGIATTQVAAAVRTAVLGLSSTTYKDNDGKQFPIILHSGKASSPFMEDVERVSIPSLTGDKVPLRQISDFSFEHSPSIIDHYNFERVTTILADVKGGYNTAEITSSIRRELEKHSPPQNINWKVAGEEASRDDSFGGIVKALIVALIGIFALLVTQFRNFSQPFIVFTAIPFAISGSILALLITGYSFSFTAFIGFTSLMGIVVNNSIILIDYANQLRINGQSLFDTIIEAATKRFTPIVLTTITTLLGLFPLILTGSSLWAPLAWVITGGLAVSTVLTLFIVPALYLLYTGKDKQRKGERNSVKNTGPKNAI